MSGAPPQSMDNFDIRISYESIKFTMKWVLLGSSNFWVFFIMVHGDFAAVRKAVSKELWCTSFLRRFEKLWVKELWCTTFLRLFGNREGGIMVHGEFVAVWKLSKLWPAVVSNSRNFPTDHNSWKAVKIMTSGFKQPQLGFDCVRESESFILY